jgi:hypothetical protein
MDNGSHRLVQCVQRKLQSMERSGQSGRLVPHEVAELESRIRRLQTLSHPTWPVRLSRYVTSSGVTGERGRAVGVCVATEV